MNLLFRGGGQSTKRKRGQGVEGKREERVNTSGLALGVAKRNLVLSPKNDDTQGREPCFRESHEGPEKKGGGVKDRSIVKRRWGEGGSLKRSLGGVMKSRHIARVRKWERGR